MTLGPNERKSFRTASWIYLVVAITLLLTSGQGVLSLLNRVRDYEPGLYGWLDLVFTLIPFGVLVYFGMKTPEEEAHELIKKNKS